MNKLPPPLQKLILQLRKFPGVGTKTAERYAFEILSWPLESVELLAKTLSTLPGQISPCPSCHCLKTEESCLFCDPEKRDSKTLCIVSFAKDIYPIEETRIFRGMYHVLGGLLSPLNGHHTHHLDIEKIKIRIKNHDVKDIILALDSTLEGDATSLFLKEELLPCNVQISRLAFGLPMGSSLEYVDPGTLTRAFTGRRPF